MMTPPRAMPMIAPMASVPHSDPSFGLLQELDAGGRNPET